MLSEVFGVCGESAPIEKAIYSKHGSKMQDAEFLGDTDALIRSDEKYKPEEAYELVRTEIIERL